MIFNVMHNNLSQVTPFMNTSELGILYKLPLTTFWYLRTVLNKFGRHYVGPRIRQWKHWALLIFLIASACRPVVFYHINYVRYRNKYYHNLAAFPVA